VREEVRKVWNIVSDGVLAGSKDRSQERERSNWVATRLGERAKF
jgi:hypothetical protein